MTEIADLDIKKALVNKQKCFSKLTAAETEMLAELLEERHYKSGDVIVTQGDPVDSVYFIVDGTADVRRIFIKNDKEAFESLAKLSAGQSVGLSETGFYSLSGIRTATVVAETNMFLYRLSVASFNGFALAYPHVGEVMRRNSQV